MASKAIDDLHNQATEAEVAEVNKALLNGDSLPAGFTFDPHDARNPVKKLKDAEAVPAAPAAEGA